MQDRRRLLVFSILILLVVSLSGVATTGYHFREASLAGADGNHSLAIADAGYRRAALLAVAPSRRNVHRQALRLGPEDLDGSTLQVAQELFVHDIETVRHNLARWIETDIRFVLELICLAVIAATICSDSASFTRGSLAPCAISSGRLMRSTCVNGEWRSNSARPSSVR